MMMLVNKRQVEIANINRAQKANRMKYLKLAGQELLTYCKKNKIKLNLSNYLDQATSAKPYVSLYFDNGDNKTQTIYISQRVRNRLSAVYTEELNIKDDDLLGTGEARFSTMDLQFYANPISSLTPKYPLFKTYTFVNNNDLFQTFQKTGVVTPSNSLYTESFTERWTTWVYVPSTIVYCLVYKYPLKIYAMQNYSNFVDKTINYNNLILLAKKLTLPEGWTFTYISLGKDTYLTVPSNGKAIVVSDELQGSYMYIQPKAAPWLYSLYSK